MFDDTEDFGDLIDGGENMEYKATYKKIKIKKVELEIEKLCRKFVHSMADVYAGLDLETDIEGAETDSISDVVTYTNKYKIAAANQARMEEFSLKTMMFQVKMGKHVLKSLVSHLNGGGQVDDTLFDRIFKAQTSLSNVTQILYKYMRTLPTHFKTIAEEMKTFERAVEEEYDYHDYEEADGEELEMLEASSDDYTMLDKPCRGHGALLDRLSEVMEAQKKELEKDITDADKIDVTKEGNIGMNPLRGEDGKIDTNALLGDDSNSS